MNRWSASLDGDHGRSIMPRVAVPPPASQSGRMSAATQKWFLFIKFGEDFIGFFEGFL